MYARQASRPPTPPRHSTCRVGTIALSLLLLTSGSHALAQDINIDDFEDITPWTMLAASAAQVAISPDAGVEGKSMRIEFDLNSGHGFVILRRPVALRLPRNYVFNMDIRGDAPVNDLEFKLVDTSGQNVWRRVFRNEQFTNDWRRVRIRKSRIDFAWGPNPDEELGEIGAIEIALKPGEGGRGSVWLDNLRIESREPPQPPPFTFQATASSSENEREPGLALDGLANTGWHSEVDQGSKAQWFSVDLGREHEFGGVVIDWDSADYPKFYELQVSEDGATWTTAYRATHGNGGRDYLYLPDSEARYLRLQLEGDSRGQGFGITDIELEAPGFSASYNSFFQSIASESPPGAYPKYLRGKQTLWTVVGAQDDDREALINEEGMVEVNTQSFSVEPFLYVDGQLWTWNDVSITQGLEDGYLPIPNVVWKRDALELSITAFASGAPNASTLYLRYAVRNTGTTTLNPRLFLALRPFQVSPPWQALNMIGGVSPIRDIAFDGQRIRVNGDKTLVCLIPPDGFGAATFEEGSVLDFMRADRVPFAPSVSDPFGFASALLRYDLVIAPGSTREIAIAAPFHAAEDVVAATSAPPVALEHVRAEQEKTASAWRTILDRVHIDLPASADHFIRTFKSTLAYVLVHRDGAAIQPGSRAYARSWIRDGALTSTSLLQAGFPAEVREFLAWYAPLQFPDGKMPCCVDRRGPDPTPEHDSNGEFIYAVAEYYRFTRDAGLVHDLWPHIVRAVDYLAGLRAQRMTAEYQQPDKDMVYGILPESISHEGYSSHPVHSYWDDFFALRGIKDAADLAEVMGDRENATRFAALRDDFRRTLYASIERTMTKHGIDYIPASVELGDFDPTSTALAISAASELGHIPRVPLRKTFDKYLQYVRQRERGKISSEAYSAYELRNVQALVRLGRKQSALKLTRWLLADQRPVAWNQWPEISWKDKEAPHFIGDLPHTWVGSAFVSGLRGMLAYEREFDHALVLTAGVPAEWVMSESGIGVQRLPTYYGVLSYTMKRESTSSEERPQLRLQLSGNLEVPPGGIVVRSPLRRPLERVVVNGSELETFGPHEAIIRSFPADILLSY